MDRGVRDESSILVEGATCWKRARAERVAFLIDADAYFAAVADAIASARKSIFILGWDLHTEVRLRRNGSQPSTLAEVLLAAVKRNPELRVRILLWDYALVYLLERQPLPLLSSFWLSHRRIRIAHDATVPPGASHHQKVVVVDDGLGFAGGIDLTDHRWDTTDHRADDARRVTTEGTAYAPFHDVQMAVDGAAAAALGELARDRWRRATGERIAATTPASDPWSSDMKPDVRDADVGIARTRPQHDGRPTVREVERLFVESIRHARRFLYIENQYLSADKIADALIDSLRAPEGPEIVFVVPAAASGWLEQSTMDVLRTRVLERLRRADRHGRMRVYVPVVPSGDGALPVYVHAKVMVVDDVLARVGSANLSNRSMGFDTECDLAIEADGRADVAASIRALTCRLVCEHLGETSQAVEAELSRSGSLIGTIEALRQTGRTLQPGVESPPTWLQEALPSREIVDPERPLDFDCWLKEGIPRKLRAEAEVNLRLVGALALASSVAVVTWAESSWPEQWASLAPGFGHHMMLGLLLAYLAATLVPLPTTLLTVGSVLAFGVFPGAALAALGLVLNALAGFWLGGLLKRDTVRRLAGTRLNRISRRLAKKGILAVTALRLLPVTPFAVVGLVAGASRVRTSDYVLGTLVGVVPNVALIGVLVDRLVAVVRDPGVMTISVAAGLMLATGIAALSVARRLNATLHTSPKCN